MDRDEWYIMLMTCGTRYLPSRCCGRVIYYRYHGDEWCEDHRCTEMTHWGERCARQNTGDGPLCAQHFSLGLRKLLAMDSLRS